MGWVWREDVEADGTNSFDITNPSRGSGSDDRCSTRRFITSKCTTEEVEPGKFVRKCQKTEQILRDCLGKPTEVVQSNKEYTEDDVTEEVMKGPTIPGSAPFEFPGLRSDIEAIERSLFGGINRFFEAAEDMRNGFFRLFDDHHVFGGDSSTSSLSSSETEGWPLKAVLRRKQHLCLRVLLPEILIFLDSPEKSKPQQKLFLSLSSPVKL